ncbi:APH-domain-containing protein [Gonapodya prolifera JEL478]|uniref:APH-domain-containing protein n=1 Tax=Gonapodya prolifera (strain JEL478) TaxID=1344416 RepID=A0A139AIA2_GONPJ|nr:APH-domain-containing protein [Gonapodya prolifera JEL478]|eukprot:KXS16478.1 APH-domain-containing protein [Gonapodya prolifera JEL478]
MTASSAAKGTSVGTSTTDVRQTIDVAALARHMHTHVTAVTLDQGKPQWGLDVKQFGFGQINPTYFLKDAAGKRYVMRKKPPGKLVSATAHQIEREYRVMDALEKHSDFPVPTMHCLCTGAGVLGTPFYIMEFIEGRIFADNSIPGDYTNEQRWSIWKACISTLAHLHSLSYTAIGLSNFGRAGGYYIRQIRNLSKLSETQD